MASFKPKQVGKGREKEKIKFVIPFRSFMTRNRKFQKRKTGKFKNLKKKPLWLHLKPRQVGKG